MVYPRGLLPPAVFTGCVRISQEDLAYEAGVDHAYASRIERAVTYVGLEIIGKFAEVLKVDPVEFFVTPSRTHRKS
ncbi:MULTISPECIES: helix-turn-helix transcriptional regulator [unclassified Bradyrhizobium]|uniref:helix-turn-helix domain-containing protein n=1 Tax=unclassified Bradyrhizobium TaxID=2631580 RepID=UPI002916C2A5|nr:MULTISPECIES: helix-turn-helix transcriptional regulator [unclassified Bradyrhizobium]